MTATEFAYLWTGWVIGLVCGALAIVVITSIQEARRAKKNQRAQQPRVVLKADTGRFTEGMRRIGRAARAIRDEYRARAVVAKAFDGRARGDSEGEGLGREVTYDERGEAPIETTPQASGLQLVEPLILPHLERAPVRVDRAIDLKEGTRVRFAGGRTVTIPFDGLWYVPGDAMVYWLLD